MERRTPFGNCCYYCGLHTSSTTSHPGKIKWYRLMPTFSLLYRQFFLLQLLRAFYMFLVAIVIDKEKNAT
jgi:hypothetical protein